MLTTDNLVQINARCNIISHEKNVKPLGITVDNKLSFEPHLNKICKKGSQKLHILSRIPTHISQKNLQ